MEVITFMIKRFDDLIGLTAEHAWNVTFSMAIAIILGVIVGILITYHDRVAEIVLYIAGIILTIPSIALFGFFIPILGIGFKPAVAALILYAQLPILRNTYVGIKEVDPTIIEAGRGMGMTELQLLYRIKLPLALPVIMAGIRVSVVMIVGIAAIASYIGAGGLGEYIFRGISSVNDKMVITGAIWVAAFALLVDFLLGQGERCLVPRGLRK